MTSRSRGRTQLGEYRRKRRFDVTAEPEGKVATQNRAPTARLAFVVQKHRATALHYDFRLEWRGVMRSWAVPKGPSLDPSVKRMAMQVEDHPLEYNRFEGVIPAGEYGGGTVMIWDRGTWKPESSDVDGAFEAGQLKSHAVRPEAARLLGPRAPSGAGGPETRGVAAHQAPGRMGDVHRCHRRRAPFSEIKTVARRDRARRGRGHERATDGDPPALPRRILKDPTLIARRPSEPAIRPPAFLVFARSRRGLGHWKLRAYPVSVLARSQGVRTTRCRARRWSESSNLRCRLRLPAEAVGPPGCSARRSGSQAGASPICSERTGSSRIW